MHHVARVGALDKRSSVCVWGGGGGEGEKGLLYMSMLQVDVKQWQSPLSFYACVFFVLIICYFAALS